MEKISTVLDTAPEIQDKPGARRLPRIDGDLRPRPRHRSRTGASRCCTAIEFHVPAGRCLALVGESGRRQVDARRSSSAASTTPIEGAVRVDGHDLRDDRAARVPPPARRRAAGSVPLRGTIADNIRFAKPDATDEEVAAAARAVGVDRIAARLRRAALTRGARRRRRALCRGATVDLDRARPARRSRASSSSTRRHRTSTARRRC